MDNQNSVLAGRVVIITGVGRQGQLGEVVARSFSMQGAHAVLIDMDSDIASARAGELQEAGYHATWYACDLSIESEVAALVPAITELAGEEGIYALINIAGGFASSGKIADSDFAAWQKQFTINLTTAYLSTRAFLPLLRKARGSVIYFAAAAALPGEKVAGRSAYVAAKSGVLALMRAVAQEERDSGVRANAIAPTAIRTAANIDSMGSDRQYVEREEIAAVIHFLCSPDAGVISGEVVRVA